MRKKETSRRNLASCAASSSSRDIRRFREWSQSAFSQRYDSLGVCSFILSRRDGSKPGGFRLVKSKQTGGPSVARHAQQRIPVACASNFDHPPTMSLPRILLRLAGLVLLAFTLAASPGLSRAAIESEAAHLVELAGVKGGFIVHL